MFLGLLMVMKIAFYIDNREFFDTAIEEMSSGASWEYTGPRPLDPTAKSLPLAGNDGEKFILFKLKK